MITPYGYSKDPSIVPEGIVITFGKDMMDDQGGIKTFLSAFLQTMAEEEDYWMHKCKNKPTFEIDLIYIVVWDRLWGKVYFGGYRTEHTTGVAADGTKKLINWPHLILSGPFEKCPFKRKLRGFQGFRYCTKLF